MSRSPNVHTYDKTDPYSACWDDQDYLTKYYKTKTVALDEKAVFQYTAKVLKDKIGNKKLPVGLEFGCGPTIHHAALLVPYVEELHMSDYVDKNLIAVKKWINADLNAHNWDIYIQGAIDIENSILKGKVTFDNRKSELRRKITQLYKGNVHKPIPLGLPKQYPLVASYYCVECASPNFREWQRNMKHLSSLVSPGGILILSALRNATAYRTSAKEHFPSVAITESDMHEVLLQIGFEPTTINVEVAKDLEWGEDGFDSIILASGLMKLQ